MRGPLAARGRGALSAIPAPLSLAAAALAALCLLGELAGAAGAAPNRATLTQTSAAAPDALSRPAPIVPPGREDALSRPARNDVPPSGRRMSGDRALAIATALAKVARERRRHPGSYGVAFLKGTARWQVSFYSLGGKEIAQVLVDDSTGAVLEQWTGPQVAWSMARGYPGAFGRRVNALYIWIPLSVLFVLPFFDRRRPFRLLHLDLLMLSAFSLSLAFFNHGRISASVPLAYPPLAYLLLRMLAIARIGRRQPDALLAPEPLALLVPTSWLAVGIVFLLGFRVGLNVTDSNVIDVGYAGVIGANKLLHGQPLYGNWPSDNQRGDTYGPVGYAAYAPFVKALGWSGRWDDLPAAHAAAVVFDLLAAALLFLLGRRVRGPTLGIALAYAWVAYPFTLFAAESNSNDSLVAVLVIAALLGATSPPARGALAALAGLTKFAPLALAPLLATHGLREPGARPMRALALWGGAFALAALLALEPVLAHSSLRTMYERTLSYQFSRGSPFSVWGLYGGLDGLQAAVQLAAVVLALAAALLPRRPDVVGLAAAAAAIVIALQLGVTHWFYLYIPWFFGMVMLALLGRFSEPLPGDAPSGPARSRQLAAA